MKTFRSIVPVLLILAVVAAPIATFAGGKHHDVKAEVVSIDAKANTITLKDENGESHTAPLMGKAVEEAKKLKAGDMVVADCEDDEKTGEHKGVTSLKKA